MNNPIGNAEIVKRVEALRQIPGLHDKEQEAIEDALNNLRFLERVQMTFPPTGFGTLPGLTWANSSVSARIGKNAACFPSIVTPAKS